MSERVIGRDAIVVMLAVFIFVAFMLVVARSAGAISKADRPDCLPGQAIDACSISAGSSDYAGFVTITVRRSKATASKEESLGMILFRKAWQETPQCEVRGDADLPKVKVLSIAGSFELVAVDDARLPRNMRWFYICKGKR